MDVFTKKSRTNKKNDSNKFVDKQPNNSVKK